MQVCVITDFEIFSGIMRSELLDEIRLRHLQAHIQT